MSVGQKKTVAGLRFLLYNRPLHPELFEIHRDCAIQNGPYEARIWVTGCTHVISFYRGDSSLVELLAEPGAELPRRGLVLEMPFRGEKDHEFKRTDGINYMMNFQAETMSPAVYSRTHHELARQGSRRGLFVTFPTWRSRSLTPFTYIDYDVAPGGIHVFAFHAFPEDLTILKTQSIFELG